jgi:hypothetical protein
MFALTCSSDRNDLGGIFQLFKVSIDCREDVELKCMAILTYDLPYAEEET